MATDNTANTAPTQIDVVQRTDAIGALVWRFLGTPTVLATTQGLRTQMDFTAVPLLIEALKEDQQSVESVSRFFALRAFGYSGNLSRIAAMSQMNEMVDAFTAEFPHLLYSMDSMVDMLSHVQSIAMEQPPKRAESEQVSVSGERVDLGEEFHQGRWHMGQRVNHGNKMYIVIGAPDESGRHLVIESDVASDEMYADGPGDMQSPVMGGRVFGYTTHPRTRRGVRPIPTMLATNSESQEG